MLVKPESFEDALLEIAAHPVLGIDTETTGKYWWKHEIFSIIVSTPDEVYYFDFNGDAPTLPRSYIPRLGALLRGATCHSANAKFDIHFLFNEGLTVDNPVCCIVRERVIKNNRLPSEYNLDSLAKHYLDESKDNAVEDYISEHKLFDEELIPGKKKISKNKHFDRVPLAITQPYGEKDARLHLGVGLAQEETLREVDKLYPRTSIYGSVLDVDKNEQQLINTAFEMERTGIKVNVPYTEAAIKYEDGEMVSLKEQFHRLTGLPYQDSRTTFVKAFERLGLSYPKTAKGNASFDKKALALVDNPIADLIRGVRKFEKRIGTYYSSFLYFKDSNDVIHPNMNTGGTETGRMSYSDPNLQNVPKEDEEEDFKKPYLVRGCFVPRGKKFFVAPDYSGVEFRILLDYAGEHELIRAINDGMDPHLATAHQTGLSRKAAKTLNFLTMYGGGVEKIAYMLKVSTSDAEKMRAQYFGKMRNVQRFIKRVNSTARTRMYVRNWLGRVCRLNDVGYSYILLNHLIQGCAADVIKIAMNRIDAFLAGTPAKMLLQIHDELLFEIPPEALDLVPKIQEIMDNVYQPQNGMRLVTSCKYSSKSWAAKDMIEGLP